MNIITNNQNKQCYKSIYTSSQTLPCAKKFYSSTGCFKNKKKVREKKLPKLDPFQKNKQKS